MRETYDGIEWDIDEMPVGSSTPDNLFEYSYRAKAKCLECGNDITGTANYWSRNEDGTGGWINGVDYKPCEHY